MRTRMLLLSTALLTGGLATPALAGPPHEPLPPQPPVTLPLCGTENGVTFTEVVQREKTNTKTGRVTGALKIRVTNEDTGESVLVNASGPGMFEEVVDEEAGTLTLTFDFTGRSLIFPFTPDEQAFFQAAGLPDIFTTSGPVLGTVVLDISEADEDNPPTVIASSFDIPRNRVNDVCALIT